MVNLDLNRLLAETFIQRIEALPETPSTNDLGLRLAADESLAVPCLISAERQTLGRGRGGNQWWANDGALTFSVVGDFMASLPQQRWPQISLAVGLAVCETLEELLPRHQVAVKWPNDVFLEQKKVCGVLIEATARPVGRVVIGIGVNVNNSFQEASAELREIATSLVDVAGFEFDRTDVLVRLLNRLEHRLEKLLPSFEDCREAWQPRCLLNGQPITVDDGQRRVIGMCCGLADDGALRIQTAERLETIYAGVVRSFG